MKYTLIVLYFCTCSFLSLANDSNTPKISPSIFLPGDEITVTYDVTGTNLANLPNAYIWVWIPGQTINAKYNVNPAATNATLTDNAKFVKSVVNGRTLFTKTFRPSDFFASNINNQTEIGMLLKGNDWSNGQTADFITSFWDGSSYILKLNSPAQQALFAQQGETIKIEAEASVQSTFQLYVNDVLQNEASTKVYNYNYIVAASGTGRVRVVATSGSNSASKEFIFLTSSNSPTVVRPSGILPGINYHPGDHTKVTLCLWAPGKQSVYVLGDFSEWNLLPENLAKRDGEYFWIEVSGLTPGQEYGFKYLVDETIYVSDPYADKVLDPGDQYIPANIYPNLKPFPAGARSDKWYFNRVSVFQTNQTPYAWQVNNFQKPPQEKLVIYELLIRDFFAESNRSYQSLIDTIGYFKRLGVNAIELMPIMEFNGNDSWGYNPTFMFAPDKAYGPKNKLKEFIDECHKQGIAVIFDIAMNHQDLPNPFVLMDYDFTTNQPTASNKWFNVTAKHPYNVFFDMNHESDYTKKYLDTVNNYWIREYKIDGYRFDLTKGFTQNENCSGSATNEACISLRDNSRIAILKRMSDKIRESTPDAYLILEHFTNNDEEKELANYGFMLWGNYNHAYNNLTMGNAADISGIYHKNRQWSNAHLVGYMESHDEERLMVRNMLEGKVLGSYSTRDRNTALDRIKAASVLFYPVPGPKMLWQFGEMGYDTPIDFNGRTGAKPVKWEYLQEPKRLELFNHTADLIRLKTTYSIFTGGEATFSSSGLIRSLALKNVPYTATPANAQQMNVQIVANFDLVTRTAAVNFSHPGTWYDYYNDSAPIIGSSSTSISLAPGAYKLYTDYPLDGTSPVTSNEKALRYDGGIYPNPTQGKFRVVDSQPIISINDAKGQVFKIRGKDGDYDISHLPGGIYMLIKQEPDGQRSFHRIVKY